MGFLKNIFKNVTPLKAVAVIGSPIQGALHLFKGSGAAMARAGGELVAGAVVSIAVPTAGAALAGATLVQNVTSRTGQPQQLAPGQSVGQTNYVGGAMAINLGGVLGSVGQIFGGNQNPYFQGVSQIASLASNFFPSPQMSQVVQMQAGATATPVMSMVPAIRGMATALTREIFDAGMKVMSRLGIPVSASPGAFSSTLKRTLSSIASLARRTPTGTMVSILIGMGLTALEANMLTAWHAQRKKGRRMNPTNPRALRRAARRIKSFHRMCGTIDLLKTRGRRTVGRCGSCKKSPCKC
jgi:hypothetical protein